MQTQAGCMNTNEDPCNDPTTRGQATSPDA